MAYYNKKLGVYLPTKAEIILTKPPKKAPTPAPEPVAPPIVEVLPYFHEVDELGIDWWICSICNTGYNSESIQKRHQTIKHK